MSASQRQILLVLRAQCGDRQAFDELLAGVQLRLQRFLFGLIGDAHAADDVLQETFVIVWKKLGWLRDPELFGPWMHRIAKREAYRRMRREGARLEVELDAGAVEFANAGAADLANVADAQAAARSDEGAATARADELERLPELVAGIPAGSRAVLLLHYWEGMSLEQAAEVLELPLGTVKSRLSYGLAALRRMTQRSALQREPRSQRKAR